MMMEKHRCKLCFRSFSNGRALGGHMRSHMMNLPLPPKPNESPPPAPVVQLSFEAESASSPSSSFEENNNNNNKGSLSYGLREKPKRNFRFSDPEFFDAGCVTLHDNRESESESSRNLTRKRSKRTRRIKNESTSSASDTTTEEDVAFCLMMLSRDKWKRQHHELVGYDDDEEDEEDEEEEEEQEEESDDESEEEEVKASTKVRGRYKCETCNKTFRSYQALGGHRASHKKIKIVKEEEEHGNENKNNPAHFVVEKKIHECPVCFRVFGSGQALGGHKRTHVTGSAAATAATTAAVRAVPIPSSPKFGDSLLDLNLPAPLDDDDVSQIDGSAVSDAQYEL